MGCIIANNPKTGKQSLSFVDSLSSDNDDVPLFFSASSAKGFLHLV
jgi:hypothetical protein